MVDVDVGILSHLKKAGLCCIELYHRVYVWVYRMFYTKVYHLFLHGHTAIFIGRNHL